MNAVDTNILIYVYDRRDPAKSAKAAQLVESVEDGVLLWQVACEFLAASQKLNRAGIFREQAWERLNDLMGVLRLALPSPAVLNRARLIVESHSFHFWNEMIFASCLEANVKCLYTEDLPGAEIAGLKIINPFA